MKQKNNNLILSLAAISAIMTLLWTSSKVHSWLVKALQMSTIEFYIICAIICIIVVMNDNRKERQKESEMLYEKITSEYKKYVSTEVKCIQREIVALKESIEDVGETMKTTNETIIKTNDRIDTVILKGK